MKVWCDGSGWSNKKKKSRVSVSMESGGSLVVSLSYDITCNEAEHLGFLFATILAHIGDEIITDSEIVYKHILGESKVNYEHLKKYVEFSSKNVKEKRLKVIKCKSNENIAHKLID